MQDIYPAAAGIVCLAAVFQLCQSASGRRLLVYGALPLLTLGYLAVATGVIDLRRLRNQFPILERFAAGAPAQAEPAETPADAPSDAPAQLR